ncbi:ubiquitin-protein ligase (Asi3) [Cordyceps javanica]|uniref:Ubiquitin-protein ligase (Asi3) n=1 Tax=Cordyceps javanica TaxID=43265 RepID=A0A545UU82_9HYPO|nr:ubiquitin-protein ligase (Asi3) [Cordyceps javanica]TQW04927.1 ubiquitin-protein ligase (Asi3) [Cordyceps javanica]
MVLSTHVKYAPFATKQRRGYLRDSSERDLSTHLETALRGTLIADRWPKSGVDVVVTIIEGELTRQAAQDQGIEGWEMMNVLSGCITVASAAIADAGIDCVDTVAGGVAAMVIEDESDEHTVVLDPVPSEHATTDLSLPTATLRLGHAARPRNIHVRPTEMEEPHLVPSAPVASVASLGGWSNLSAWATNMTRYAPSFDDLVWAGPRILEKLGSYLNLADQPNLAPNTDNSLLGTTSAATYNIMESNTSPAAAVPVHDSPAFLSLENARSLGSVFSYATSRWAMSCIAMALILNRTHIFAATRRRLRLQWKLRLLLRFLPIVLLVMQVRRLLMSMQCQTSANFAELRWGDPTKHSRFLHAHTNHFLNTLSSILLFGATDQQSCAAINMIPVADQAKPSQLVGSLSAMWPLFGTFCLSHFIETVSCAVQGRTLSAETGMTLFEQSLAFAEADATISNQLAQLNWDSKPHSESTDSSSATGVAVNLLTKSMLIRRVNTPPEVLLVAFLSSMTHLTSHILGLFDLQAKYRLVNTGFWGICFMGSIVWSAFSFDLEDPTSQGLLRFPTVCIIGFVPHVLVFGGILLCFIIYGLALLLSALSPPPNQERSSMSFRQRLIYAHENMQANVSFAEVRITRDMDFYTALLRTGFAAITMASEAVYLNEDNGVNLKRHTWLEEARYREAEEMQRQWVGLGHASSQYDRIGAIGLIPVKDGPVVAPNGYARERAAQKVPKGRAERSFRAGVGAADRSSRWVMALDFFLSIFKLVGRVSALLTLWMLRLVRIRRPPGWLMWLAERSKTTKDKSKPAFTSQHSSRTIFISRNGRISRSEGIDVEAEFRRIGHNVSEENLDKDLYSYFIEGGWWGSGDSSGDYAPSHVDDEDWDTTSVISQSTSAADSDVENDRNPWEPADDEEDGGQKTPTQRSPRRTRENTPVADSPMGMSDLARLLRPTNREEREEATTLAAHLVSDGVMTRGRFRRLEQLRRTSILTSPRRPGGTPTASDIATPAPLPMTVSSATSRDIRTKLDSDEEEVLLEQLLLSRREEAARPPPQTPTRSTGPVAAATASSDVVAASGSSSTDEQGPLCVVCQSAARTIIVWPCRCLSLCDDCRVSLAMNNFDKCVCCRRDVLSFSRIYVP